MNLTKMKNISLEPIFCGASTQKTESNKTLVQGYDIIVLLYIAIQVE